MEPSPTFSVLFLCTGNSARSILAEELLRRVGNGRFTVASAGSHPRGAVHPMTLRVLKEFYGIDASSARSKSWEEFTKAPLDFVITVCDQARETCPVWPGRPVLAHWGSPDPAAFVGEDAATLQRFRSVAVEIHRRVELFCALPIASLERWKLEEDVRRIGAERNAEETA